MKMNNNRLNFIYKLNHIVNENAIGTVEYELAKYFLDHFTCSKEWNIYQIAEELYVSRASIRRFAKQVGYDNFSDMKKSASTFDDGIGDFQLFYGYEDFLLNLQRNIQSLMEEFSIRFNTQEVNRLVKMISSNEEVMIVCSSNIAGSVKTFQQRMVVFGKRVTLLTSKEDLNLVMNEKKNPLIIFFSISGVFVSSMLEKIKNLEAQTVLFTNDRSPIYNQIFDKIYHFSTQNNKHEINQMLYYTYGMDFVLDLLFNGYVLKFKKEGY
jgi:DNA-binding MurR/RpiR family transcriptional regulator